MSIRVETTYQYLGGQPINTSAIFTSREAFEDDFRLWVIGQGPNPFGIQFQGIGSDSPIFFFDPNAQAVRRFGQGARGPHLTHGQLINRVYQAGAGGNLNQGAGIDIIQPQGSNIQAIFRYRDTINQQNPTRSTNVNRRTGTRNARFRNNSNLIDKAKKWFEDPENKEIITQLLKRDLRSHIKLYPNIILSCYEEVRDFYSSLGCIVFSIVLYYSPSLLILKLNKDLGYQYTAGNYKSSKQARFRSMYIPKNIELCSKEGCPSKLISDILACMGTQDPSYIVTVESMAKVNKHFGINVVMFRMNNIADIINLYGDSTSKMLMTKGRLVDSHEVVLKSESHCPIVFYDQRKDTINKSTLASRFDCMMFTVSDLWEETMHAEALLDYNIIDGFMRNTSEKLSPLIRYDGLEVVSDISLNEQQDFIGNSFYLSNKTVDYRLVLERTVNDKHVISSANDLEEYLVLLSKGLDSLEIAFGSNSGELIKQAFSEFYEKVPTKINISMDFFRDKATTMITLLDPWREDGIHNLKSLFSYLYYLTSVSAAHPHCIQGLVFKDATIGNSAMDMRKLTLKRYLDNINGVEEDVYRVLHNLGSFSFQHDHPVYTSGVMDTILCIRFTIGDSYDTELVKNILEDKSNTLSKIIHDQGEQLINFHEDILSDSVSSDEFKEHSMKSIVNIKSMAGVIDSYSMKNIIGDLVMCQESIEGKNRGSKFISRFGEVLPIPFEIFQAFSPGIMEPVVPIGFDGTNYKSNMTKLSCVDLSKAFSNILQGGFKAVYETDIYQYEAQVGGLNNPIFSEVHPVSSPIRSYFIDYGVVFIESNRMSWTELREIDPEYFSYTSSWWNQYFRAFNAMDCYVLINACAFVCKRKKINDYEGKLNIYSKIQNALGIRYGMFDFNPFQRRAFHKLGGYRMIYNLTEDFGSIITKSMKKRFIIDNSIPFDVVHNSDGLMCKPKKCTSLMMDYSEKESVLAFNEVAARFGHASHKVYKSSPVFTPELRKQLKVHMNNYVGSLKYSVAGGVSSTQISDIKQGAIRGIVRGVKKQKVDDDVYAHGVSYAPNAVMWRGEIDSPEHLEQDNTLVVTTSVKIKVIRNSLSPFRRYVINTCRQVMDHLNSMGTVYRTATDSLLVGEEDAGRIQHQAQVLLGCIKNNPDVNSPVVGCREATTVEQVDMDFDESGERKTYNEQGEWNGTEFMENKYRNVRFSGTHSNHNCGSIVSLDAVQTKQRDDLFKEQKFMKDSDILYKFYLEEGRPFDHLIEPPSNGIELHKSLYPYAPVHTLVDRFYKDFVEYSVDILYGMGGCLLLGDPGTGKTYRSKLICKKLYSEDILPVVTAAMHSIITLYGDCELKKNKKLDCMTIYRFVKCGITPEVYAKSPKDHIKSGGYDHKCLSSKYGAMICDEIETFPSVFQEFLKVMKEDYGMIFYLVGDPLQSAPMMDRGFDVEGSCSRFLTGNNVYTFDLQFRNTKQCYQEALALSASGKITHYLDPSMSTYQTGNEAIVSMYMQMQETADELINGDSTRIYACANYNFQMCIVTSVIQLVLMRDPDIMKNNKVLFYTGHKLPNAKKPEYSKINYARTIHRGFVSKGDKEILNGFVRKSDRNGVSGADSLIGSPLIMKKGIQFRVMNRFKLQHNGEYLTKIDTLTYVDSKVAVYKVQKALDDKTKIYKLDKEYESYVYRFEKSNGDLVVLAQFEVQMYLVYAFAIQREFVLGTTLDRLTIAQPYYHVKSAGYTQVSQYRSIKSELERQEATFGEDSIQTKLARLMRVCVTRVEDTSGTFVFDIDVEDKRFWEACLWDTPLVNYSNINSNMNHFTRDAEAMLKVVQCQKYEWKIVVTRRKKVRLEQFCVHMPEYFCKLPYLENNELDVDTIKKHAFPLYLVNE